MIQTKYHQYQLTEDSNIRLAYILSNFDYPMGETTIRRWVSEMLTGGGDWDSVTE